MGLFDITISVVQVRAILKESGNNLQANSLIINSFENYNHPRDVEITKVESQDEPIIKPIVKGKYKRKIHY
jgi:hypothetical protein